MIVDDKPIEKSGARLLTVDRQTAAEQIGISLRSLDRLHAEGRGPKCVFLGGLRRYRPEALVEFVACLEREAEAARSA